MHSGKESAFLTFLKHCGARLTVSYPRIGGVRNDISQEFLDELYEFVLEFPDRMDDYETLVTENRVWKKRTVGIGVISAEEAVNRGLTGGMLRGLRCEL